MRKLLIGLFLFVAPACFAQQIVPIVSGNAVITYAGANSYKIFVTGAVTVTIVNQQTGTAPTISILFAQDATGHTVTLSTGFNSGTAPTISASANANTSASFQFDGNTNSWYGISGGGSSSGVSSFNTRTGAVTLSSSDITTACTGCTQTIANGTSALGTGAITSGACATVVTTTATGVATTDNIMADFNADPTSTTGYSPSANGMLTIIKYPTSGNVNFKVCNNTASSVTPGAVTLNWRVVR